jgi:hypothetical protein
MGAWRPPRPPMQAPPSGWPYPRTTCLKVLPKNLCLEDLKLMYCMILEMTN